MNIHLCRGATNQRRSRSLVVNVPHDISLPKLAWTQHGNNQSAEGLTMQGRSAGAWEPKMPKWLLELRRLQSGGGRVPNP